LRGGCAHASQPVLFSVLSRLAVRSRRSPSSRTPPAAAIAVREHQCEQRGDRRCPESPPHGVRPLFCADVEGMTRPAERPSRRQPGIPAMTCKHPADNVHAAAARRDYLRRIRLKNVARHERSVFDRVGPRPGFGLAACSPRSVAETTPPPSPGRLGAPPRKIASQERVPGLMASRRRLAVRRGDERRTCEPFSPLPRERD
jgi:hypothetical protein